MNRAAESQDKDQDTLVVYGMTVSVRLRSAEMYSFLALFQYVQHWKRELSVVAGGSSGGVVGLGDGALVGTGVS